MLSTKKAFELYSLLEKHLPEEVEDDVLDFIGKIIRSMIEKGEHGNYANAIMLMHNNIMLEDLDGMKPEKGIELFTTGLVDNKILRLHEFCKRVG